MAKDDWYFFIGVVLAIAAFFGVDWKFLKGKITTPNSQQGRQIALLLLIVGSLAMSAFGWYNSAHPDVNAWRSSKQETIYARSYRNETVEIDGKIFDRCHFENVKLLYHGLRPVTFNQSDFKGELYFGSDNIAINQFMILKSAFDQLKGLIRLNNWVQMDKNGNLISVQ